MASLTVQLTDLTVQLELAAARRLEAEARATRAEEALRRHRAAGGHARGTARGFGGADSSCSESPAFEDASRSGVDIDDVDTSALSAAAAESLGPADLSLHSDRSSRSESAGSSDDEEEEEERQETGAEPAAPAAAPSAFFASEPPSASAAPAPAPAPSTSAYFPPSRDRRESEGEAPSSAPSAPSAPPTDSPGPGREGAVNAAWAAERLKTEGNKAYQGGQYQASRDASHLPLSPRFVCITITF